MPTKISDRETAWKVEQRLLAALMAEFGSDASVSSGTINADEVRVIVKIKLAALREPEPRTLRERFERVAPALGLLASDFDLPLVCYGEPATLVDVRPAAPKYPMLIEMTDGGVRYRVPAGIYVTARNLAAQQRDEQNSAARLSTAGA